MLSHNDLDKLKEKLPRGYYAQIGTITKLSEKTITNFFTGKLYRTDIHEAALKLAETHQNHIKDLENIHKKLINS